LREKKGTTRRLQGAKSPMKKNSGKKKWVKSPGELLRDAGWKAPKKESTRKPERLLQQETPARPPVKHLPGGGGGKI